MLPNRSMPSCTVIPVLPYEDVGKAVDWLCETFGFTERWRAANHRAQLTSGNGGAVVVSEQRTGQDFRAADAAACGYSVMVRVDDANRHHEHARRRGARIIAPPAEYPYGERQYTAEDLAGHRWTFSQSIADVAPEEWGGTSGTLQ